jgi:2-methylisocitrate lyase-like PEP mutase family enzyme
MPTTADVPRTTRLRRLITGSGCTVVPCVHDGLTALLVEKVGFPTAFVSGGLTAAAMGLPDLGLASMTEVANRMSEIAQCVDIPVMADADTGYGNALNARRTVQLFARGGVAGLMLEDQVFPKRCGHIAGKAVINRGEMEQKLKAAREAAEDPDFVLIGRTDAAALEGLDSAIDRANAYADAGADIVFIETPRSERDLEQIARRVRPPKMTVAMRGVGMPELRHERLSELGFRMIVHPADLVQVALKAMEEALVALRDKGHTEELAGRMYSFAELQSLVKMPNYLEIEKRYATS